MFTSSTSIAYQFARLLDLLFTPGGAIALAVLPFIAILLLASSSARWYVMGIFLWLSTFGVVAPLPWFKPVLIAPLENLRTFGKAFVLALLVLMVPAALVGTTGWRTRKPMAAAIAYFMFLLIISFRLTWAGMIDRGLGQMFAYSLTFLVFGIGVSRWVHDTREARKALTAISIGAILLVIGSLTQVVIDQRQVVLVSRFMGTTANPQFLGSILSISLTPTMYLLLESRESKLLRLLLATAVGFMAICIVWTGSRTAALVSVVNLLLFFRLRLGRLVVGVCIFAASFWVASQFFFESFDIADRLVSTADTRSEAWAAMFAQFLRYPFLGSLGSATDTFAYQECTYLAVASQFGLLGLIPGAVVAWLLLGVLWKMLRIRSQLGKDATLCDVVFSGFVAFAVLCVFDAYPLGTTNFQIFYFYIYLAIAGVLIQVAAETQSTAVTAAMYDLAVNDESSSLAPSPDSVFAGMPR